MKYSFSLKYFLVGFIFIFVINYKTFIGENSNNSSSNNSSQNIVSVETGDIKETIEVSGDAQLVDEQSLKFNKAGTITKVYFKEGDSVKKGDVIAEIDNSDAQDTIEEAKINLENANLSLSDLLEGAEKVQVLQSESNIDTATKNLYIAEQELENLKISQQLNIDSLNQNILNLEKEIEISKNNLEVSKKELDLFIKEKTQSLGTSELNKSTTIKNIEESFKTYLIEIEKNIDNLDSILGYTDKYKNNVSVYEIYLGAKNSLYKNQAKNYLASSIGLYENLNQVVSDYDNSGNIDSIKNILTLFSGIFSELYNANEFTYKTADNSVASYGSLSENDIDSMKSTMLSYMNSSSNKISSINSTINNIGNLTDLDLISESNKNSIISKQESIKSQELSIEKQEFNLTNAKKSLEETKKSNELTIKSKENDLSSKKINIEILNLNYDELLEGASQINISKANNTVKQAKIKLDSAYKSLEDYQLIAPFDGVIRKIDYMVGDNITNDTDKYVYLENPDLLEITVMLDQIDVVNVNVGMGATVTFDAYPTIPANAIISSINTTPTSTSGVVSYEIKIILDDENFDKKILSGFGADVEIITQLKEDILLLKTTAISEENGKNYVTLINGGKEEKVEVSIGVNSDGKTEILSGLNDGDNVKIEQFTSSEISTTTTTSTSLFGPSTSGNRSGAGGTRPPGF